MLDPDPEELDLELELELDRELEPDCWLSDPDSLDLLFLARCFFFPAPTLRAFTAEVDVALELAGVLLTGSKRDWGSCLSLGPPYWPSRPRESFQP